MNDHLVEREVPKFTIKQAELRKFEDMVQYKRESDWAVVNFD